MTAATPLAIDRFTGEYRLLSNFAPCLVEGLGDGITYFTAEHAFQAQKTRDFAERARIAGLADADGNPDPGQAKRAGRQIALRPDWDDVRKPVMLRIVLAKFRPCPVLRGLLCATGDARLVEGNRWHDQFWGDCRCGRPACAEPGLNYLGQILEAVRLVLRAD